MTQPEAFLPFDHAPGDLRRVIGRAAALNVSATVAVGLAGLLAARSLGPSVKGQYAAVSVWFEWALIVGEVGQSAAICYFVAHHPQRASSYVATSQNIMLATGSVATVVGIVLAPSLSHGVGGETLAYRALFLSCPIAFVNSSFLSALQARNIRRWMRLRTIQPVSYLLFTVALFASDRLTLDTVTAAAIASIVVQAMISHHASRAEALLNSHHDWGLARDVLGYGFSQMLATAPNQANVNLDQLILSQAVGSGDLGQYSLAASLTVLAGPLVSPIGQVLFPRLATGKDTGDLAARLVWRAVAITAAVSAVAMVALAAIAHETIPLAFGSSYRPSVRLVWIMAPSGVCYTINRVAGDLLRGRGQPLAVAVAQLSGAAVTIIMLVTLIPRYGVTGAAITTSSAYGLVTVMLLVALHRPAKVHHIDA